MVRVQKNSQANQQTDLLAALVVSPRQGSTAALFLLKKKHITLIPVLKHAIIRVWASADAQVTLWRIGGAVVVIVVIREVLR